jgi:hypothetical protein
MHDQYLTDMNRECKNAYEKNHRKIRKRQKKAVDNILYTTNKLINWPEEQPLSKKEFLPQAEEEKLRESIQDLLIFKHLEDVSIR